MYREIKANLIKWKDNPKRKPLLLTGVRKSDNFVEILL